MTRTVRLLILLVLSLVPIVPTAPAVAHEGPPFPIVVDHRAGPYMVSIWTDPDIGTGVVYVILEPPKGMESLPPGEARVRVGVQPVTKRLPEVFYDAEAQPVRHGARYFTEAKFDRGEMWRIRAVVEGPQGGGEAGAEVEATPDGTLGPGSLVLYLMPFLAIGFIWLKAILRRREAAAPQPSVQR
ncbi:MAG TPA: hypothetical protein VEL74_23925 [Thermoanaerobaculia bacterium]|nr:hypothetical protein [Thermoanaerobaculia bacterium]